LGTVMTNAAEELIRRWQRHDSKQPLDVANEMMKLTLIIVGKTLFSTNIGETDEIGQAVTVIQQFVTDEMTRIISLPPFIPTPSNLCLRRALRAVDGLVYAKITERRADKKDHRDLLSMLLAAKDSETGAQMSDQQLRDEIVTMISAGHETTANALSWTWHLLSQHRAIAQKLLAELDSVLRGRTPTIADLPRLEYTTLVLKESMRLIPPVWAIGRHAIEDDFIGGYRIPANSLVMLSPYMTHRHRDFWDNPEEFRPERFQSESALRLPRFAYFPFGGGPHLCIGNSFAMMEAQLLLATIAQKFELHHQSGQTVELEPLITIRPKGGLWMNLYPRQAGDAKTRLAV
jgi:cytochrome P450